MESSQSSQNSRRSSLAPSKSILKEGGNKENSRRVSFFETAKVRPVPRRKSSMVPEGGFAMPDLSSDRRRSSNAYGVLLEPPAQQNPDNSISSTEMFDQESFEVPIKDAAHMDDGTCEVDIDDITQNINYQDDDDLASPTGSDLISIHHAFETMTPSRQQLSQSVEQQQQNETTMMSMELTQPIECVSTPVPSQNLMKQPSSGNRRRISVYKPDADMDMTEVVGDINQLVPEESRAALYDHVRQNSGASSTQPTPKPVVASGSRRRSSIAPGRYSIGADMDMTFCEADTINDSATMMTDEGEPMEETTILPSPSHFNSLHSTPKASGLARRASTASGFSKSPALVSSQTMAMAQQQPKSPALSSSQATVRSMLATSTRTTPARTYSSKPASSAAASPVRSSPRLASKNTSPKLVSSPRPQSQQQQLPPAPTSSRPASVASKRATPSSSQNKALTSATISPLHKKVLGIRSSPSPRRGRRSAGGATGASSGQGTPLKNAVISSPHGGIRTTQDETLTQHTLMSKFEEETSIALEEESFRESYPPSDTGDVYEDDAAAQQPVTTTSTRVTLQQLFEETGITFDDEMQLNDLIEVGTNYELETQYYERMCKELEYSIERDADHVSMLERQVDESLQILMMAYDDVDAFKKAMHVAKRQADVIAQAEWAERQLDMAQPLLQGLFDRVQEVESAQNELDAVTKALKDMAAPVRAEFVQVEQQYQAALKRKQIFKPADQPRLEQLLTAETENRRLIKQLEDELMETQVEVNELEKYRDEVAQQQANIEEEKRKISESFVALVKEDPLLPQARKEYQMLRKVMLWELETADSERVTLVYREALKFEWNMAQATWSVSVLAAKNDGTRLPKFYQLLVQVMPEWFTFKSVKEFKQVGEIMARYESVYAHLEGLHRKFPVSYSIKTGSKSESGDVTEIHATVLEVGTKMERKVWRLRGLEFKMM